ncbi:MAG: hypothetical protein RIC95_05990 [Vicingaceae bacterium]
MSVIEFRLLVDFGLLILIWMIQLIVYPSFVQFDEDKLRAWHPTYNRMITLIVAPLMFAQLGLVLWQIGQVQDFYTWSSAILVLVAWVLTFFQAVPLHHKISAGKEVRESARKLVKANIWRSIVWTAAFLFSLFKVMGG